MKDMRSCLFLRQQADSATKQARCDLMDLKGMMERTIKIMGGQFTALGEDVKVRVGNIKTKVN